MRETIHETDDINESSTNFELVSKNVLLEKIDNLFQKTDEPIFLLLGGQRIYPCDEGIIAEQNNEIIGVATIAPRGEENSGQPTIVALYILPQFRRKGYGKSILEKTVERCKERGFNNVRIDAISHYIHDIVEKLPNDLQEILDVHSSEGNIDTIFKTN